jgi:hypothetical protein
LKLNYYILLLLFSTLFLYGCSGFFDSTEQKQAIDFDKNLKPILVELDLSKNELNSFNDITTLKLNIENNRNDNSLVYITIPDVPIMSKSKNFKNEYEVNLYGKTDENYIPLFEYGERIEDLTFGSLAFGIGEYMDDLDTDLIAHVCTKYKDEIYAFVCVNEDVCGKSSISNFKQKIGGPIDIKNIEFINHFSSSTTGVLEISMHFENNANGFVFTSNNYKNACRNNVLENSDFKRHEYNIDSIELEGVELDCKKTLFTDIKGISKIMCLLDHSLLINDIKQNIDQRLLTIKFNYNYKQAFKEKIKYKNEQLISDFNFEVIE